MNRSRFLALIVALAATSAAAQSDATNPTRRRIVSCVGEATMAQCSAAAEHIGVVVRSLPLIHAVVVDAPVVRAFAVQSISGGVENIARIDEDKTVHWLNDIGSADFNAPDFSAVQAQMHALQAVAAQSDPRIPWGVARVGAPQEWKAAQGDGAAIAVIDTGIDATHPDLQGQVAGGVNILDAAHPDNWADDEGHGTHVSGTIAGKGVGLFGVAPKAKLYAVKVLDKDGNGDYSGVIAGIQWAMNHGIKILNMSLGAPEGSDPLHAAVLAAQKAGVTIIAAAGNTGGSVGYPGAYPEVIAVGASDSADHLAPFSSRGPQVSFIAPGVNILSAKMGGGYITMSGTSMATPHMAGLAALAWSLGVRDPQSLRAALARAARPINGLTPDDEGNGLVLAGNLGVMAGGATFADAAPSAGVTVLASLR